MRRAAKIDASQSAIVGALRACGAKVHSCAALGGGFPDLLVGFRKRLALFECKDGAKPKSARALTPDQAKWLAEWGEFPVFVVEDIDSAIAALHLMGDAVPPCLHPQTWEATRA
jgi:hypothetical protein